MAHLMKVLTAIVYLHYLEIVAVKSSHYSSEIDSVKENFVPEADNQFASENEIPANSRNESHVSGLQIPIVLPIFKPAENTRETVNLETERLPSKVFAVYDKSHQFVNQNLKSEASLIDTIDESEKYGNEGKFAGVSRSFINGYEAFANLINTAIEKPKELVRSIFKGASTRLDTLGRKLIGL